jgi:hypothetical protein
LANASAAGMTLDATYLITRYSGDNAFGGIGDNIYSTSVSSLDSRGFWVVATNGSRLQNLYKNGSSIASNTGVGSFANNNLYLGAANGGGTALFYSDKQYAFCSIGNGLSGAESSSYNTIVQAFQTALGRNV